MSQQGQLHNVGTGAATIETLTGNSGGAVGPDASFNVNILGNNTTGINVVGMPGTNTLSIVGIQATTTQRGTVELATDAEAIAGTDSVNALTSSNLTAKLGTQTLNGLPIGAGNSSALSWTAALTDGQLLIGDTGSTPVLGNLTSTGGTITITNGPGTINLDLAGGTLAIDQIFVDFSSGTGTNPVVPNASGQISVTGAQVATGTVGANVIRSASLVANAYTMQVQRSTSAAATDSTKNGVSHFDSSQFSVDANGFVHITAAPAITTINGDSGSITGNTVTIFANNATQNSGSTVKFVNSGTTSTLNVTDASSNTLIGSGAGNGTLSSSGCTGAGKTVLASLTSGINNTAFGYNALNAITSSSQQTAIGYAALQLASTGSGRNTGVGFGAGSMITTGAYNTIIGNSCGSSYTSSESSNIVIGESVTGTVGESNVLRIGRQGSSTGQQNACYISGIAGVTSSNPTIVTQDSSTTQLGVISFVPATSYTPSLKFGGGSTGLTYTTQLGRYTRIGNMVTFSIDLTLSNKGSSTGTATVTLPVTAAAGVPTIECFLALFVATTTGTYTTFDIVASGTTGTLVEVNAATGAPIALTDTAFTNSTVVRVTGSYWV